MPAVALEAVDLVALCGILLLMGLLAATAYTFSRLASAINVSIFGSHPFAGVAHSIDSVIVAGCNDGIKALGSVAHDLWAGAKWSFNEVVKAIMAIPRGVHDALTYLWKTAMPAYVKASLSLIHTKITALEASVSNVTNELGNDILALDSRIKTTATATLASATKLIESRIGDVERSVTSELTTIKAAVEQDIKTAVHGAESTGSEALSKLRAAENAAIDSLNQAETATAADLRNLTNQIPFTDITAVIAAVPLLKAALNTLESEAGLERPECRAKVKGICGVDPSEWANLLEDIALIGVGLSLRDIFDLVQEGAKIAEPVIHDLVTA